MEEEIIQEEEEKDNIHELMVTAIITQEPEVEAEAIMKEK